MSDTEKPSWLSSPATVIAVLTVLLNVMGFLTIRTFIVRMCFPTNFFENTPIDYLQWGIKAIVSLLVFFIIIILIAAILSLIVAMFYFVLRQTIFRITTIKDLLERCSMKLRTFGQTISPQKRTGIIFIVSLTMFIIYMTTQNSIIQGFFGSDCQSVPTIFSSSNKAIHTEYEYFSVTIIILLSIALFLSNKIRNKTMGSKFFSNIFTCGIFSIWLLALAFWAMSYRLMLHNEFEEVHYNDSLAYIISEKDARLFLYIPGEGPFIIEKNDSLLNREGKIHFENIFNNKRETK